ncbi:MAG: NERD domain-containing protein [Chloroflexi bacterium]|nr:MAG: NERD domain-containing protein [Chloroflexota bacterium]
MSKLSDNFYVINDVKLKLDKSVFFDNAWLSSAQIDHLVISPAGVFVIEVKNWSKKFTDEGNFYSPYQQVKRHNYVCYTLLNRTMKTTVRSIVAYSGHIPDKPNSSYAKVLPLEQVNGYILWFKDVNLDAVAMQKIAQIIEREIEYAN